MENVVAVINAFLDDAVGAGRKVQFAGEPAGVAGIGEQAADQFFIRRHRLSVLATSRGARITPGEKGGAARRANRALAIGAREGGAVGGQGVEVRCADMRITQRGDGVRPLLVGADPQNVWWLRHTR